MSIHSWKVALIAATTVTACLLLADTRFFVTETRMKRRAFAVQLIEFASTLIAFVLERFNLLLVLVELRLGCTQLSVQIRHLARQVVDFTLTAKHAGTPALAISHRDPVATDPGAGSRDHRLVRRKLCAHVHCIS